MNNCVPEIKISEVLMNFNNPDEWPPIGKIAAHSAYDMFHGIST